MDLFFLPGVTDEMVRAEYWYRGGDANVPILSDAEIDEINHRSFRTPETRMTELGLLPDTFSVEALKNELRLADAEYAVSACGLQRGESADIRFGVCIRRTQMMKRPYQGALKEHSDDALSAVHVNDALAVYLATDDGAWYYVRSAICSGWIPSEDAVLFGNREEMRKALSFESFLVVTGCDIALEADSEHPELSFRTFEMGTRLELAKGDIHRVSGRLSCYNYVVWIPTRGEDGSLRKEKALIPISADVSVGFLPFTKKNLLTQAFKSLGRRYSWGGAEEAQDCSSYIREVYSCFGFQLPRNTTWQSRMPARKVGLEGLSDDEKSRILGELPTGSILFFPGHEILYLGARDGDFFVINNLGPSVLTKGASVIRVYGVTVNSLRETARSNGQSWLEAITHAVIPFQPEK